jgi:hypothetical protein
MLDLIHFLLMIIILDSLCQGFKKKKRGDRESDGAERERERGIEALFRAKQISLQLMALID